MHRAQVLALEGSDFVGKAGKAYERVNNFCLFADACLVNSLLALSRGSLSVALSHARRNVRLLHRAWDIVERQCKTRSSSSSSSELIEGESQVDEGTDMSISTTIPSNALTVENPLSGPLFWPLVYPLFRGLTHLSQLYAHHGMFQETMFYAEQAQMLAQKLSAFSYTAITTAAIGSTWMKSGTLDKASDHLHKARDLAASSTKTVTSVMIDCHLGKLKGLHGSMEEELEAYENAQLTLERISNTKYICELDRILNPAAVLEAEMSKMTIATRKTSATRKAPSRAKAVAKKALPRAKTPLEPAHSVSDECLALKSLKGSILREKGRAFILSRRFEEAIAVLREADSFTVGQTDTISQHLSVAKQLLVRALEQMTADPVYSALQDSTISFPCVLASKAGASSERTSSIRLSPPAKLQGPRSKSPSGTTFFDKLRQAQEHLIEAHSTATQVSSSSVVHNIASLLNATIILLSAAGHSKGKVSAHPGFATCSIEMARSLALIRERGAVTKDGDNSSESDIQWPLLQTAGGNRISTGVTSDVSRFQKEYIDIIPPTWTAISISLSESKQELCLTKMQAGHGPFVLRLPLGRNNSRDVDEQVFDFEQGHTELLEIIELANESAHGARGISGKGAKTAWWAERDEIDARLKELLANIEKVWLGGFRGMFSQHARRQDMLARFQKSFQNILDKYLPSRQKTGKRVKSPRVTLDTRILELFIGLGDPSAEDCDFDEPLTDLLYFVVDILQFHGEQNACDEIDFDAIIVETHDALRCYHEAVLNSSILNEDRHTILILDKTLHAFPWESLPCMEGLAVSRLPSLGCLHDRLMEQKFNSNIPEGHHINRHNGAYILNPSGDLATTQTTFERDLSNLESWDNITNRIPSESEFQEHLETKDLLLYFGHGSGAQYIRPKVIKRMEKCAVTVLMGCSSGALTESGEFEPYGTPINYMLAGCPALVATLWDVTDKDIDRFAKKTFEEWGLFKAQPKPTSRGKGVARVEEVGGSEKTVSLVEAVARGRAACNMKYLTAAAVCVYGIPVYFK
jgi:separase